MSRLRGLKASRKGTVNPWMSRGAVSEEARLGEGQGVEMETGEKRGCP